MLAWILTGQLCMWGAQYVGGKYRLGIRGNRGLLCKRKKAPFLILFFSSHEDCLVLFMMFLSFVIVHGRILYIRRVFWDKLFQRVWCWSCKLVLKQIHWWRPCEEICNGIKNFSFKKWRSIFPHQGPYGRSPFSWSMNLCVLVLVSLFPPLS